MQELWFPKDRTAANSVFPRTPPAKASRDKLWISRIGQIGLEPKRSCRDHFGSSWESQRQSKAFRIRRIPHLWAFAIIFYVWRLQWSCLFAAKTFHSREGWQMPWYPTGQQLRVCSSKNRTESIVSKGRLLHCCGDTAAFIFFLSCTQTHRLTNTWTGQCKAKFQTFHRLSTDGQRVLSRFTQGPCANEAAWTSVVGWKDSNAAQHGTVWGTRSSKGRGQRWTMRQCGGDMSMCLHG